MTLVARLVIEGNAMLDGGKMAQIRANTVQQKREEVYAALQYAAYIVRWSSGTIVNSLNRSRKTGGQEGGSEEAPHGVACGRRHTSLHEVRKVNLQVVSKNPIEFCYTPGLLIM